MLSIDATKNTHTFKYKTITAKTILEADLSSPLYGRKHYSHHSSVLYVFSNKPTSCLHSILIQCVLQWDCCVMLQMGLTARPFCRTPLCSLWRFHHAPLLDRVRALSAKLTWLFNGEPSGQQRVLFSQADARTVGRTPAPLSIWPRCRAKHWAKR